MAQLRGRGRVWRIAIVTGLILAPLAAVAAAGTAGAVGIVTCSGATTAWHVNASVSWNGQDICVAGSAASPISTTFGHPANVTFTWDSPLTELLDLSDARLAMYYLGFPIVTRDIGPTAPGPSNSGEFVMSWSPGELTYAFEGLFRLTATIFAANGTSAFSENFYVKVTAPASIAAVLPIGLLALGAYEVYNLAVSGRQALLPGTTRPTPPKGGSTAPSAPEPPEPAAASPVPPPPPPSGGGA